MNKIAVIKMVREATGMGLADAVQAVEAVAKNLKDMDYTVVEDAIAYARENLNWKPKPREEARTKVGVVKVYSHNDRIGAMLELLCDTDFVAKSDDFQDLAHSILLQIVGADAQTVDELLAQPFVRDPSMTMRQLIDSVQTAVKEAIVVSRFARWEISGSR